MATIRTTPTTVPATIAAVLLELDDELGEPPVWPNDCPPLLPGAKNAKSIETVVTKRQCRDF